MIAPRATAAPFAFGHRPAPRDDGREAANLETARRYLAAIEADTDEGATHWAVGDFLAPDIQQEEFPNRIVPAGARRDFAAMREGAERGRKIVSAQRYEVRAAHATGDTVILEVLWVGTPAVPVGALAPGEDIRAHFCVVLEFRDGRVARQRNYDCFEPF